MAKHLKNIDLKTLRKFLEKMGCEHKRTSGGHEHWTKQGLNRPLTFQTHIEPVPEFIIKQILKYLQVDKEDFWEILENKPDEDTNQ